MNEVENMNSMASQALDISQPAKHKKISELSDSADGVEFIRLDSSTGHIDGVFKRNKNSKKLIIMFPAALPQSAEKDARYPYIPRWKWALSIDANVWCFEEAIARKYGLLGGWFQESDHFYADTIAKIIVDIAKFIGVEMKDVVLTGSSLGGFGALMVGSVVRESKVIADITQTNLCTYPIQRHIEYFCSEIYGTRDVASVALTYPDRFSVLERFKKTQYVPDMIILHELSDEPNGKTQVYDFLSELGSLIENGAPDFNLKFILRANGNGHAALGLSDFKDLLRDQDCL